MSRPQWSESWMTIARDVALRSLCDGAQVGTVIVDKNNRIVATGYNGPPQGFNHEGKTCSHWCQRQKTRGTDRPPKYGLTCPSIHSEANALMFADRRDYEGGTLYVTSVCCEDCSKLVSNSGVRHVHMRVGRADLAREIAKVALFMLECDISVSLLVSQEVDTNNEKIQELVRLSVENEGIGIFYE